jgi:hypothetical protein
VFYFGRLPVKKFIFLSLFAMALCILFVVISCGGNTSGNATIVITYNANGWTGSDVPTTPGSCASGAEIGAAALPALTNTDTQEFLGWSLTADGEIINAKYKPLGDITLYVKWKTKTTNSEYVTMSYDANGIIGLDMPAPVLVEKGKPVPSAKLPVLSGGNIMTFHGWSSSASGGALSNNPQGDFTVYASAELEFTEKLILGNGQFALYRFALPDEYSFNDFTKITVDYLVEDEDQIKNKNVGMILHGVYNGLMLEQVKNNDQVVGIQFPLTNDTNNASIINNLNGSIKLIDQGFSSGKWKTVEYKLSGSRHVSFNNSSYLPVNNDLYIYFGLGITASVGDSAFTSYITNIKLSNDAGNQTIASTGSGFSVAALAASSTQWETNLRKTVSGTADDTSGITLPYLAERHILSNGQFALYKFDIPAGSKLGDYTKITVDYMIENPVIDGEIFDVLEIRDGRMRLMGAYTEDMLFPVEVSGRTVGYRVNMPSSAVNDPSILNNLVASARLVKVGFFSGQWKEFEFPFTGNRPAYYDPGTYFPEDASGTLYFGLGITTITNQFTYTSHIRNIRMTNNDGSKVLSPSPVEYDKPAFFASAETWSMNSRKEVYLEK